MKTRLFEIWALLLIAWVISVDLQEANAQQQELRFRHISNEDGLSNNTVFCIVQDEAGFMWFGTNDGLNRFDSRNFRIYRHRLNDTLSLWDNRIITMLVDSRGHLWVGTAKGLNLYDRRSDCFHRYLPENYRQGTSEFYIRSLAEDDSGRIWVGTSYGLYQFDPEAGRFVVNDPDAPIPSMFVGKNVINIQRDPSGDFWLCTIDGLYRWDGERLEEAGFINASSRIDTGGEIRDLLIDRSGHYWIATESLGHGVFHLDPNMRLIDELLNQPGNKPQLAGNRVRVLKELSDGNIWLGTFAGLSIHNPTTGSVRHFMPDKFDVASLKGRSVRAIYEDYDGGIWIGTYNGGVNYYHPSFTMFRHEKEEMGNSNSLSDNFVSSFAEQERQSLWIGTEHGLNRLDRTTGQYRHYFRTDDPRGLLDNTIKSLELDGRGNLWIGSLQGLSRMDLQSGEFVHYVHDRNDSSSLGHGHIHIIYCDSKGDLWIGTNGGGLNLYQPEADAFQRFTSIEDIDKTWITHINALAEGRTTNLWAGTSNGLELFDRQKGLFVRPPVLRKGVLRRLSGVPVQALYMDPQQNLWIGYHGFGLVLLNTETGGTVHLTTDDGLADNTIKGILGDEEGNVWVSSNGGLTRIDEPEAGWMKISRDHVLNFNTTDGLQGNQYYRNAVLRAKDGTMYFGGTNGFNAFDPNEVSKTRMMPEVVFTDLVVRTDESKEDGIPGIPGHIENEGFVTLQSSQTDFSIQFAALNYYDPDNTVYAYMLEPVNDDWQVLGSTPVVNFSQLAAGDYIFKVKATNTPDQWGSDYSELSFRILPPFWRTGLAFLLYMALLGLLLFIFFQVATRWGRLKSDLVHEHHEREKEHALHQQRIRFFTNISHELRTPLTLILAPLERLIRQDMGNNKLKNQLLMIQRNGERMLQLINQLLDLRKLETGHMRLQAAEGDIVRFMREIVLSFRETAQYRGIRFTTHLPDNPLQYWYDRDKLEIVLYNLLSNAIKNTPRGGHIGTYVRAVDPILDVSTDDGKQFPDGYLEIIVEDDGRGISEEDLRYIFNRFYQAADEHKKVSYGSGVGLEIVKRFIDLHKGSVEVESFESKEDQPGKTRFVLKLPAGRKHLKESDIIADFKSSEDIDLYKHPSQPVPDDPGVHMPSDTVHDLLEDEPADRPTLLIIEDNEEVRQFITGIFRVRYRILEAPDGVQGLASALEHIPDLIISDVMMPEMDGMALCRKVKSDDRTSHIPVILLSARTAVTHRIEGMETGADDYVTKPFSADELSVRVRNLIEQRKKLREKFGAHLGFAPEDISITSVDEKLLKRTFDYIETHMSDPDLNVEKVAAEVGLSRVHFYRKIRALTNLSPVAFIRRIRLEQAARLLETGKLNVSEVRYAIGIQDPNYFRKVFKAHFGTPPSAYGDDPTVGERAREGEG